MSSTKNNSSKALDPEGVRTTSLTEGIFNLCKSAIGIGALCLPYRMQKAGLALGLGMLAFGSLSTASTLHFLARIAANTDLGDYFMVGRLAYGNFGEMASVAVTLIYLLGALIVYSSFSYNFLVKGVRGFLGLEAKAANPMYLQPYVAIPILAVPIFAVSSLRDLSKLAKASVFGMICMTLVCLLTVVDYFLDPRPDNVTISYANNMTDAISAFPSILFALCNHFTMLAIVPKLVDPTPARRTRLLISSSTFIFVFYFLISLFGYLHFGNTFNGKMIVSMRDNVVYNLAKLIVAAVIIVSYPLLCDPTKSCVFFLLNRFMGESESKAGENTRNLITTGSLVAVSSLVAIATAGTEAPIEFIGVVSSLCGSFLMFILPSLFFLKLSDKYRVSSVERVVAYGTIALGLVVLVVGTYKSSLDFLKALKPTNP